MNRGVRRSMGTVKATAKPQRSSGSTSGFNPPQPSSGARNSRLPRATSGSASKQKRSNSNEGLKQRTSAALGQFGGSAFRTPRSKSATNRTPSSNRAPLSNIGLNSAVRNSGMRSPHAGKRSSVYGHHGQPKDTRPLTDKEWQRQFAKELQNFCLNHDYPNPALAPKDVLQMSTSTFKSLFEFLIQFAMPDYTLKIDSNNPLQTVLFELLRKMNYPGPLNKSHFQTIGGFNLSHNLGVLHFLWTLAKLANGIFDDFSKINWPNTDQDGFAMETKKSTSEIEYNFFTKAYKAYNDGQDEFPNEIEELYWELMDSLNVNEELIRQLEDDLNLLEKEHHELNEPSSEIDKLNEESVKHLDDIKGLQEYLEKQQKYFTQKQIDLKTVEEKVKKLNSVIEQLNQSILILESECRAKNIDPKDTSNHAQEFVQALYQRVESKKAEVNEADKMKWKYEQSLSKKAAVIDNMKHEFNKLLINFNNIDDATRLREIMEDPALETKVIQDLKQELKKEQIELTKQLKDLKESLNKSKDELAKKENELSLAKQEEMEKKQEKTKLLEKIKSEEDDLKKKLEMAQKKLRSHHGEKNRVTEDLKDKEKQLQSALADKMKEEENLKKCKQQGEEFINYVMEDMKKRRTKLIQDRDAALEKYEMDCEIMSQKIQSGIDKAKNANTKMGKDNL